MAANLRLTHGALTEHEADDDAPRHDLSEPINQLGQPEDAREVQGGCRNERGVPAGEGVAVVW